MILYYTGVIFPWKQQSNLVNKNKNKVAVIELNIQFNLPKICKKFENIIYFLNKT